MKSINSALRGGKLLVTPGYEKTYLTRTHAWWSRCVQAVKLDFVPRSKHIYAFAAGSIPPELGNLATLQRLHLGSNQLSGTSLVSRGKNIPSVNGGENRVWCLCETLHPKTEVCPPTSLTCELVPIEPKHLQLNQLSQLLGDGSYTRNTAGEIQQKCIKKTRTLTHAGRSIIFSIST